jgi:hypothetical protein
MLFDSAVHDDDSAILRRMSDASPDRLEKYAESLGLVSFLAPHVLGPAPIEFVVVLHLQFSIGLL